ncbi:MAG: DNA replication/repair protein RecF [bacterium]
MRITNLQLKNYRNICHMELFLGESINIFYGDNAQGKTNILESIYVCAIGRSHRTHKDKELIKFGEDNAYIALATATINNNYLNKININIKNKQNDKIYKVSKTTKGIAINNIAIKKIGELFGNINIVMFSPEDLNIVKQSPQERRKFLDMELCQINNLYNYNLSQYYKILKQRNMLLKKVNKSVTNNLKAFDEFKNNIYVWDKQLIEVGTKVINNREEFVKKIDNIASDIHFKITNKRERLSIKYKPSVNPLDFEHKLLNSLDKDIIYKSTSYGPHKDDIVFYVNDVNLKDFGSQGQQRTAILSTKLAEIDIIKLEKNIRPILLLDDVLSELDKSRQEYLINNITDMQVIITCTGVEDVIKNFSNNIDKDGIIELFEVLDGAIINKNNNK